MPQHYQTNKTAKLTAWDNSCWNSQSWLLDDGTGRSHKRQRSVNRVISFSVSSVFLSYKSKLKMWKNITIIQCHFHTKSKNLVLKYLIKLQVLTKLIVSLWSMSGQSCSVRAEAALSASPPVRRMITGKLSPERQGPPCKKEWPIIRPAIWNRLLSRSTAHAEGTRWFFPPQKGLW